MLTYAVRKYVALVKVFERSLLLIVAVPATQPLVFSKVTFFNAPQSLNAYEPMLVTVEGIVISASEVHPEKAFDSIVVSAVGSTIFVKDAQSAKVYTPML